MVTQGPARSAEQGSYQPGSAEALASLGRELGRLENGTVPSAAEQELRSIAAVLAVVGRSLGVLVNIERVEVTYGREALAEDQTTDGQGDA